MDKRGDISIGFIVGVVISLLGFVILLLIYYQLNWTGSINREVCHQSVIFRGTLPSFTKDYVPLKCETAKICITGKPFGRGDCEEFKNEKSVVTIRVSNSDKGVDQIQKVYAGEILDCWSTLGEGKISLFSSALAGAGLPKSVYSSCVVCSRVAVDKASLDGVNFNNIDLYRYMNTRLVPDRQQTYFEYMSGDGVSASVKLDDNINIIDDQTVFDKDTNIQLENNLDKDSNGLPETAIVFTQISAPSGSQVFSNTLTALGIGVGALTVLAPVKAVSLGSKVISPAGLAVLAIAGVSLGGQQISVAYNRAVAATYCDDIKIGDSARSGCSSVRTLNYDAESILNYCQTIESIP